MAEWGPISASVVSQRTSNPIRKVVDQMPMPKGNPKKLIALSIGDPTVGGNLELPESAVKAMHDAVDSKKFNGYPHSAGYPHARQAVADKFSLPSAPLTADDVVLTSGASHALDIAISVLCNEGETLLCPEPAFSLYTTLCDSKNIKIKYYKLLPERQWEADLDHMASLIDGSVRAILVNNPSNPCGSVYSADHLRGILGVAERARLPVIADEIYANMSFCPDKPFVFMSTLTETVPILSVGGLAKQYLVPGWRLGWLCIYDRNNLFAQVRQGILALTTLILGPHSVTQSALPTILGSTDAAFYDGLLATLRDHAALLFDKLKQIKGLRPVQPEGAMYLMVGFDKERFPKFADDVAFSRELLQEENVFVLPGQCFRSPDFFRIVITQPPEQLQEACARIAEFCERHAA
eukprot:NODE_1268_length_1402_cov_139.558431_g1257_i0.p1 GENE.NODE_1268_length_1402_cov_139.558431_g1257_i0~~NODE_1268_length_1402_cov_139.558431_g1257_i0.p1  ORF type:complete len:429 (+),score=105.19 NODE_1268_length_1402_cov_139.558431_g1257_i0:64-1287(+)